MQFQKRKSYGCCGRIPATISTSPNIQEHMQSSKGQGLLPTSEHRIQTLWTKQCSDISAPNQKQRTGKSQKPSYFHIKKVKSTVRGRKKEQSWQSCMNILQYQLSLFMGKENRVGKGKGDTKQSKNSAIQPSVNTQVLHSLIQLLKTTAEAEICQHSGSVHYLIIMMFQNYKSHVKNRQQRCGPTLGFDITNRLLSMYMTYILL